MPSDLGKGRKNGDKIMKVPVLVLAFNRAGHVSEAMKAIRKYQPERLYLACDGPRPNKNGEKEAVDATRKVMLDAVDWTCETKSLFRDENLGCANAVYEAISWFFENEESGIICEDDIILSQDFFILCEDLLPRYKDEERVMEISARNESFRSDIENTYVYAQCYHCWGWATWRRAWKKMDMEMSAAPMLSIPYLVKRLGLFRGVMMKRYFMSAYHSLPDFNSWATRWFLSILSNDGLVICPGVNLALNIGVDGGEHYEKGSPDPYTGLTIGKMKSPLMYNDSIKPERKQKILDSRVFIRIRMIGLVKKFMSYGR